MTGNTTRNFLGPGAGGSGRTELRNLKFSGFWEFWVSPHGRSRLSNGRSRLSNGRSRISNGRSRVSNGLAAAPGHGQVALGANKVARGPHTGAPTPCGKFGLMFHLLHPTPPHPIPNLSNKLINELINKLGY